MLSTWVKPCSASQLQRDTLSTQFTTHRSPTGRLLSNISLVLTPLLWTMKITPRIVHILTSCISEITCVMHTSKHLIWATSRPQIWLFVKHLCTPILFSLKCLRVFPNQSGGTKRSSFGWILRWRVCWLILWRKRRERDISQNYSYFLLMTW